MEEVLDLIDTHATRLSGWLKAHRERLAAPTARKRIQPFTSGQAARLLGVRDSYLRRLHLDGDGPEPEVRNGRRYYSPGHLLELRELLERGARKPGKYLPGRRGGDHLQVIAVTNFKGGSAKTTTAAHLAQKLALCGYRTLMIDIDPQASLSTLHGFRPEVDLQGGGTLFDAVRYSDPVDLAEVIQPTYLAGLDIVPGHLDLIEFEHETAVQARVSPDDVFFTRVADALAAVESRYDVVVIDCPPHLGFLTIAALSAATAMLITVHPQMLDVMSMAQFLSMTSTLLRVVAEHGEAMSYDWVRYLITRYEPGDAPQNQVASLMRSMFGVHVANNAVLKSTAISDAGLTQQTLYEVDRGQFNRTTFDRAMASVDAANEEIMALVQLAWERNGE